MGERDVEQRIDRLYQLPLDQFTAARNALAKTATGKHAARVRSLPKPNLAAWAVNQLHWQKKATYDRLVKAAEKLRTAHREAVSGRRIDLRDLIAQHREAVEEAFKETLRILEGAGDRVSSATTQAIAQTIVSLPADAPAGRLTGPPELQGFEIFAGLRPGPTRTSSSRPVRAPMRRATGGRRPSRDVAGTRESIDKARRESDTAARAAKEKESAAAKVERALQQARDEEASGRRESDAAARAAKEKESAAAKAERALQQAKAEAERAHDAVEKAQEQLERARERITSLTRELDRLRHEARTAERQAAEAESNARQARARFKLVRGSK